MANNFEIKEKIVRSGNSKIFENWRSLVPTITMQDFLDALAWVCEDVETGRLTREIGLTKEGIVKIRRINKAIVTMYRMDNNMNWNGDNFRIPCDNPDFADKDGKIWTNLKISLSARDRV